MSGLGWDELGGAEFFNNAFLLGDQMGHRPEILFTLRREDGGYLKERRYKGVVKINHYVYRVPTLARVFREGSSGQILTSTVLV
jgi:hypothetical protein